MSTSLAETRSGASPGRLARRHGWTVGAFVALAVLVFWQSQKQPQFGPFEVQTLFFSALPLAFLAMGQSIVIISGGIDLSVGAMAVLGNCVSARLMEGRSFGVCLLVALGCIVGVALLGALTGWICVASKVPDIIVTLATSFIWNGLALFILANPGGGTNDRFATLFQGPLGESSWWPALLLILGSIAIFWLPIRWRTPGLSIYAVGSDRGAAYLSGVNVGRARIGAYALSGVFVAMAGLALTALAGGGDGRIGGGDLNTLNSIAAAVLGGVALTGGKGGLIGPAAGAFALTTIPVIVLAHGIDPNYG